MPTSPTSASAGAIPQPAVLVLFDHGREPRAESGWATDPERFPYGYGYGLEYLVLSASVSHAERPAVRLLRRGIAYLTGFDVVHAFRNRHLIQRADAVITHTEHEYLAVALLIALRVVRKVPIVGQSVWLWDGWSGFSRPRKALYRWLLRAVTVPTVLSPANAAEGTRILGRPVRLVPYGAHAPAARPAVAAPASRTVDVVAPGSDRHRDWRTLIAAAVLDPDLRVTIVSRRRAARLAARRAPARARVIAVGSSAEVRDVLDDNAVVAIPLRPNLHASGLTVLYEAMAARRPVVVTETGGIGFYGGQHTEGATPGDAAGLAAAIRRAHGWSRDGVRLERAWSSVAERGLTMEDYGLRHVLAVWVALGLPVDPALMSVEEPLAPIVRAAAARLLAADPAEEDGRSDDCCDEGPDA